MSLTEFQRAFSDLIASPARVLQARAEPATVLAGYALTERERRRLVAMCNSDAMEINCTLYRVNRLTPIYSVLPRTCHLLGAALASELTAFWQSEDDATLQFHRQSVRFGAWLGDRRRLRMLPAGPWEDALRVELTMFEARTSPSDAAPEATGDERRRWVELHYDPAWLFDDAFSGAALEPLAEPLWLCVDASGPELVITATDRGASSA